MGGYTNIRALVLREIGRRPELEEVKLLPPEAGEVRIRVVACGLCRSDLANAEGTLRTPLPVVLGHEAAGVVVETGEGVEQPAVGDRVVVSLSPACGQCPMCENDKPHLCFQSVPGSIGCTMLDGSTRVRSGEEVVHQLCAIGGFAEQAVVNAACCIEVPDELPLEQACLLGCGVMTGAGAVLNTAAVKAGQSVAVIGCGGVGLAAVQAARIAGAATIVAVDLSDSRRELALAMGATDAVDGAADDVARQVKALCRFGPNVVIEAVGKSATIEAAWRMVGPAGKVVVIGMPSARDSVELRVGRFFQACSIEGCVYGSADPRRDIPRLLDLASKGELDLGAMVTRQVPLEAAADALAALSGAEGARQVIVNDN